LPANCTPFARAGGGRRTSYQLAGFAAAHSATQCKPPRVHSRHRPPS
jgi:hypothetical protein